MPRPPRGRDESQHTEPRDEDEDFDVLFRRLLTRVVEGPGALDPRVRRQAVRGQGLEEPLAAYVGKILAKPESVTVADVEALQRAGLSEDEAFELTVTSALGAAKLRLDAGLRALQEAEATEWPSAKTMLDTLEEGGRETDRVRGSR